MEESEKEIKLRQTQEKIKAVVYTIITWIIAGMIWKTHQSQIEWHETPFLSPIYFEAFWELYWFTVTIAIIFTIIAVAVTIYTVLLFRA